MVKHRFSTPLEEVVKTHNLESLQILYNEMIADATAAKGTAIRANQGNLPDAATILAAAKVVLPQFPYEEIEQYNENTKLNGYYLDVEMIQNDFPTMTPLEIEQNSAIIDEYYSNNLDYLVLNEIATHPKIYVNSLLKNTLVRGEVGTYFCTMLWCIVEGYGFVRSSISYAWAGTRSETSSKNYFYTHSSEQLSGSNDRRDAYRHTLWNALLAQYYLSVGKKRKRIGFAKLVSDVREDANKCGTGNAIDGSTMDLHNNAIGRKIWSDNTSYRRFLGVIVGLKKPSTSQLKDYCLNAVAKFSCYIVKTHKNYPNDPLKNYTTIETKQKIEETNSNTIVYFNKTIAPRIRTTTVAYDYSDCDNGFNDIFPKTQSGIPIKNAVAPIDDCVKVITTVTVRDACFVSKDPNYNPYN